MRSTFKILFFLKRDKVKTNGTVPLFCRITVDGQEARFSMKCDVHPKYWDVKTGRATGRTAEAAKANTLVDNTQAALYKVYRELQERTNYVTAEKVKNVFLGHEQKHQTLLELFDNHNEAKKNQIDVSLTKSSWQQYVLVRRYIAEFLTSNCQLTDIPVMDINREFIVDFETYLFRQYNLRKNTIGNHMKKFRHIIALALEREIIFKNPFKEHKLQKEKTDRGFLTQPEIEALMNFKFEDKKLERARNLFIFCVFTGLSYKDALSLQYDNIQINMDGNLWIKGKRKKTDTEYNIPLMNIPKAIIEKYRGKTVEDLVFPFISCQRYNLWLKKVAQQCGIRKNLTSHLARHTFATHAIEAGVSIESVSKMLGHTNIATTQIYARITENKIGKEMSVFAGKVLKMDANMLAVNDITIDNVLKSLKISKVKASEKVWETLTDNVWQKMETIEKQSFVSEMENKEKKPKTIRDFYLELIDYFLENLPVHNDHKKIFDLNFKLAVNF